MPTRKTPIVSILDHDPELLALIPRDELDLARRAAAAPLLELEPPRWEPYGTRGEGWLGVLVLEGLLLRLVSIGPRTSCELLGPGDVLRPWDSDGQYDPLPVQVAYRVLEPTRVAVLDDAFARRIARWPLLSTALLARTTRRARYLALTVAVAHLPGAQARLLVLFWLLGERWGTMTADGVQISLPLTHEVLAMLIGARRPTVSVALQRLQLTGLLQRHGRRRWLLSRSAIADLADPARLVSALFSQTNGS